MAQPRQVQFMRVARRADARMLRDCPVGRFERIDEAECDVRPGLARILVDRPIDVAVSLVALFGGTLLTVVFAIAVPEIPRVARLVRSVVLSVREEPYVEAAIGAGTRLPLLLWRHGLPNTIAPLIVQGTYVGASAILTEAILSFLGAGIPTEVPSWGNVMAEGRQAFQLAPWVILFPGLCVAATVLAVNILGDGLRDALDPRIARRVGALR